MGGPSSLPYATGPRSMHFIGEAEYWYLTFVVFVVSGGYTINKFTQYGSN